MMWRGQEGTFNEVAGPLNPVFIMGVTHRGGDTFEHRPRGQQVAWANICLKHPCIPRCCNWFRQHVFNTFYQEFQRLHMLPESSTHRVIPGVRCCWSMLPATGAPRCADLLAPPQWQPQALPLAVQTPQESAQPGGGNAGIAFHAPPRRRARLSATPRADHAPRTPPQQQQQGVHGCGGHQIVRSSLECNGAVRC